LSLQIELQVPLRKRIHSSLSSNIATFEIRAPTGSDNKTKVNIKQDIHGNITYSSVQMVEVIIDCVIIWLMEWTKSEFEAEVEMKNHDRIVRETSVMRKELKSYIYGIRNKIISASHVVHYYTDCEQISFSTIIGNTKNWLHENEFNAKSIYA